MAQAQLLLQEYSIDLMLCDPPHATVQLLCILFLRLLQLLLGNGCCSFLLWELKLVELLVSALPCKQLVMRAGFEDDALIQHIDGVGLLDRRQPMRDDEAGTAFEQSFV